MDTTWKRPAGRAWARVRTWMALALVAGLAACGGGGGSSASVRLSQSEIRLADSYDDAQSPAPQSVSVTVDGDDVAAVGVGYDSSYPAADWVGAQLSGTRSPYTLLVGVGSAAPVGEHTAHLVVGALDAQGRALDIQPLTVHYKVMARLRADSPSLAFAGVNGATPPEPQTLSLRAEGLSWTAEADQPWILLSQASGTGASDLTVSVDDAGLASGAHTGHIAFTASDGQTLTVPVSFELTSTALTVTPSSLTFGGATGRDMAAQAVELSLGTDGNAYAWRVQSLPAWLAADVQEGTVSQTPQTLRLTPDPAQLAAGTHTARLVLAAEVNGDTITQEVALTIHVDGRRLYLSHDGVAFTSSPGWSRLSRTLTVKDNFGTATAWTASSDQGWLTVTGSGIGGGPLALNANPAALAEGLHMAKVTVRSADARFASSVVHVGLWKSATTPAATITRTGVSYRQLVADTVRPFVYVHSGGTSIDVYNPYTNALVATMSNVGNALGAMSVAPDGQRLYVVDNGFSRMAVVDLNTRRRTHFMATTPNNGQGLLATRVKGTDVVLVGNRTVYRASDGARVDDGSGPMGIMVAGPGGERVYTQNTGTSPSGGGVYAVDYTGAFGGRFVSTFEGGAETGSNGQDIAVAPDGSTVYTASGAPYRIQTFRGSDFSPIGELPEFDAYPNNVDVGTDGRVAGGIDGSYSTHDIWVYSRTGAVQKRYKVVGYAAGLRAGTLNFTPDALMLATLSDDNRMVFIPVGP